MMFSVIKGGQARPRLRAAVSSSLLPLLLSVSLCACDRSEADVQDPSPLKPSVEKGAPKKAQPPSPPPPWYQGSWRDENEQGVLELKVDAEGGVTGRLLRGQKETQAAGRVDLPQGALRLRLLGPRVFGSLVATRSGAHWEGTLRASEAATIDLEGEPLVFGQKWQVRLSRASEHRESAP